MIIPLGLADATRAGLPLTGLDTLSGAYDAGGFISFALLALRDNIALDFCFFVVTRILRHTLHGHLKLEMVI